MDTRRDFLKKAALLSGSTVMMNMLPPAIQKALAISPDPGTTFYDAEHIVFLMQENRSFDHVFGALQGVRGFNDPRAVDLPNKNKVWLQSNKDGDTHAPFKMDVRDTKVAWMGSVPHNWANQTDARNMGRYNRWLDVKKSSKYPSAPLTLGYGNRNDFPFYYSLADAFTVCDQSFCSSITGTHSNRYYWMSGTVREWNEPEALAHLWNFSANEAPLPWKTYPERLEEQGVSWKIYQNEISTGSILAGENAAWLSNFGTNVMEYFKQYNVKLHPGAIAALDQKRGNLLKQIDDLEKQAVSAEITQKITAARRLLARIETDRLTYTMEKYNQLSDHEKNLIAKAFATNSGDPDYHELTTLKYSDKGTERELKIPKGDVLHQFRHDVEHGALPTVSWLMPPANLSDHPSNPWFGPLYVSEIMEILTKNPEVWKKTIFILTYDENDGYFDHVPPFVVPNPYKEHTGKVSKALDTKLDFATNEQQYNPSASPANLREGPIGLGFRVPLVIASPWTRGGYVCSEVFDHTSSIQFVENFLEKKLKKTVKEENISPWRRAICGDLTSAFRPYNNQETAKPAFLQKDPFIELIHHGQFNREPDNYNKLNAEAIAQFNAEPSGSPHLPKQEKGIRQANPLPYELYADGQFNKAGNTFGITFKAGNALFGQKAAGAPFCVYMINDYQDGAHYTRDYAAIAGDTLQDEWNLAGFKDGVYHLKAHGPNGFYREFKGDAKNPLLKISLTYERNKLNNAKLSGNVVVQITNNDTNPHTVEVKDASYQTGSQKKLIASRATVSLVVNAAKSHNWYDVVVNANGYARFEERFAGRVETGEITKTDPLLGGVV
ncbi:phosphocholine-specific phospholipase C [Hufsiella ginkgonis]|uniref:phospholipase C n=1 Tax=Hufsiella ginkgonis TaxID=2695274 RepID=A0A7K1XTD9_9SPHI|nr:phospholipase C, phosphocholine-specific [Hufsiella ginkgonis]MXV14077.1 phospholipase C, phosphocholine-specific [Hufsiella ginkgonis]